MADLCRFSDWAEVIAASGQELAASGICYLWDDFSLACSPVVQDSVIFAGDSESWRRFCSERLDFVVPGEVAGGQGDGARVKPRRKAGDEVASLESATGAGKADSEPDAAGRG